MLRRSVLILAAVAFSVLVILAAVAFYRIAAAPVLQRRTQLSADGKLEIVRRPAPADFHRRTLTALPKHDPDSTNPFQVDLRGYDLTGLGLTGRLDDLRHADFDAKTRWPAKLPSGFAPGEILEQNKNPGLGVRALHARGITGKGISIGIIDQTLLTDHVEYADRLRLYEEIHLSGDTAQMHGPAVASIAVGRTVGVAPGSDLYYIAETHGTYGAFRRFTWDFTWLAKAIERLLDVNQTLPREYRIRVISISVGWNPQRKGCAEADAAVERAKKEGVFIISTALERTYRLAFHGLGRELSSDPDDFTAYRPGSWWAATFWQGGRRFAPGQRLLVPMDRRAVASPTGAQDYVFYADGGWSWSVPWIAGLYALACEVKPDITPEVFWAEALATGRTIKIKRDAEEIEFGTIADPVALITKLQSSGSR